MSSVFFYIFSALILIFGVLTVTTRGLFRSAIYLLFTLANIAALYFMLHYEFIAAVQIIVYVGGIVVLILFSLFLTQQSGVKLSHPSRKTIFFSALAALSGFGFVWTILSSNTFILSTIPEAGYDAAQIGRQMLSLGRDGYMLPFEAISILLLAAMIGSIAVAMKEPSVIVENRNGQSPIDRNIEKKEIEV
jgi:NADH-quinone oxidoreductase subunit J